MCFKDLKIGDKVYAVTEHKEYGLRIETISITNIHIYSDGSMLFFIDNERKSFHIEPFLLGKNSFDIYFLDLDKAEDYFLEKYLDFYSGLIGKAFKYLEKYNTIKNTLDQMSHVKSLIEEKRNNNGDA